MTMVVTLWCVQQQPVQLSLCRSLYHQFHWKCFTLTLVVSGCLTAIAWCKLTTISSSMVGLTHENAVRGSGSQFQSSSGGANGFFDGPRRTGVIGGSSGSMTSSSSSIVIHSSLLSSHSSASACDDGYIYIPAAFVLMMYIVYLIECWHCRLRYYFMLLMLLILVLYHLFLM